MASYNLANQAGASFRAALNVIIATLQSNAYGTTDPAVGGDAVAGMWWVDTGPTLPTLKMRNVANTAWITIATLNGADFQLESATLISPTINTNFTFDGNTITGFTGSDVKVVTGTAGTSGNVATWNADGDVVDGGYAPGAMVFIESQNASVSATLDFTGFDATKYDSYVFEYANLVPSSNTTILTINTSSNGGSTYDAAAGDYAYSIILLTMADTATPEYANSESQYFIALTDDAGLPDLPSSTGAGCSGTLKCNGAHLAKATFFDFQGQYGSGSGTPYRTLKGGGVRKAAADVDALRFLFNIGTITSGTVTMYGLRNS